MGDQGMGTAEGLRFSLSPAALRSGSAEERAAFGIVAVTANGSVLTEGISMGRSELQCGPYVSGYQLSDADRLGRDAVAELAADAGHDERPVRADEVREDARRAGFDARVEDAARLASTDDIPAWGECQAWRVGVAMAQALRAATALNGQPVANAGLCELAGTSETAIQEQGRTNDRLSFALDDDGGRSRIALRSKWETGRRFDLARLMADRLQCLAALDPFSPDQQPSHWPRVGPVTVRSDRRQVPIGFGTTAPCPRTTPLPSGREPSSRSGPTDNLLVTSGELHERAECYCGACCSRERAISDSTA